jgi:NADH-quinone oxidoreductase subunit H
MPQSVTIYEAARELMMGWGLSYAWAQVITLLLAFLVVALFVVVLVLLLVLLERRLIAWIQLRPGPNRVGGRTGILQTVADALKLLYKEDIIPLNVDRPTFLAAPYVVFVPALAALVVMPFGVALISGSYKYYSVANLNIGLAYILAAGAIGVIGIIMAGWSSSNKYALIGSMRTVAQLISYEVPMVLSLISVALFAGSLSLVDIVQRQSSTWAFVPLFFAFIIFFICGLAETNRCPFDLMEAESEIVAGFHTEYSGMRFALFFLAEYLNMFVIAALITTCFFGGWKGPMFLGEAGLWLTSFCWFMAKTFFFVWCFIWFRGTFPRIRVDQLMVVAWKFLLPLSVVQLLIVGWGITYRNPLFSANLIPSLTAREAYAGGIMVSYKYMTLAEGLGAISKAELVAFGWSVLGALVVVALLAGLFYRTVKGYHPSREFLEEIRAADG